MFLVDFLNKTLQGTPISTHETTIQVKIQGIFTAPSVPLCASQLTDSLLKTETKKKKKSLSALSKSAALKSPLVLALTNVLEQGAFRVQAAIQHTIKIRRCGTG